jgi:hypothetical protein
MYDGVLHSTRDADISQEPVVALVLLGIRGIQAFVILYIINF